MALTNSNPAEQGRGIGGFGLIEAEPGPQVLVSTAFQGSSAFISDFDGGKTVSRTTSRTPVIRWIWAHQLFNSALDDFQGRVIRARTILYAEHLCLGFLVYQTTSCNPTSSPYTSIALTSCSPSSPARLVLLCSCCRQYPYRSPPGLRTALPSRLLSTQTNCLYHHLHFCIRSNTTTAGKFMKCCNWIYLSLPP